jgi:hypothetical protein
VKSLLYYTYWKGLHKVGRRDEKGFAGSYVPEAARVREPSNEEERS